MSHSTDSQPVTIVVKRLIKIGHEAEFEEWVKGVNADLIKIPGHLGVNVIRPSDAGYPEYVLIFRYDSYEHLRQWEESPERAAWLEKSKVFTEKEADYQTYTGLEYWFSLPEKPHVLPPNRWKMAAITWLAIFPLSYGLPMILVPLLKFLPTPLRHMIIVAIIVLLMTFVVMPTMTRLFARWLFPRPKLN